MERDHPPKLYLICGRLAAGKSTLARSLAMRPSTLLISEDHWMSILFPTEVRTAAEHGRHTGRLCAAMEQHIVELLRHGFSVVLDFHANTVKRRAWMRSVIAQADVAHELHVLDAPDDLCRQRLRERNARGDHLYQVSEETYDLFMRFFVPPEPSEGFNIIVHTPDRVASA